MSGQNCITRPSTGRLAPPVMPTFGGTVKVYTNENVGIKYCVDRAQKLSSEYASRTPFFSESIHLGLFHISDMLMRRLSNLGTKGERNLSNPPVKCGWERVVRGSIPPASTISKRQTRPLTASGYWTGFLFLRIVSELRRFQGVGATCPITPFSGNLAHPASLSSQNSPHSYPHSPDLVRCPAFFPATAVRRSRRQTG